MPCFGSKRAEIVPSTVEDGATGPLSSKGNGVGRLESEGKPGAALTRDGLHSAPTSQDRSSNAEGRRQGLHSAPNGMAADKENGKGGDHEKLGDFIIEASDGKAPTAAAVDAYLEAIIGARIVKDLRNAEWASRVNGIEALQQLVQRRASESAIATGQLESAGEDENERSSLFRACVTVLSRALTDKVVPVYIPALALLAEVYSPPFLAPMANSPLPKAAIGCFAHQLVFRAGSSNVRAREESSSALLTLARSDTVGCDAIGPHALRPLSNSKSATAAVGRLELLRTLIAEFGMVEASGLELREVLTFTLPLCECASDKSRDLAFGLLLDVRGIQPAQTERLVEEMRPSVLPTLKARLVAPAAAGLDGLSVSGKRLPPLGHIGLSHAGALPGSMPGGGAADGEEVVAVHGTPPEANVRTRARTTATELGARNAPAPRKSPSKRSIKRRPADPDDTDGLIAEATSMLAEPMPVRLAAGNAGLSPSKHTRSKTSPISVMGSSGRSDLMSSYGGSNANDDEVSKFMSEEQLMEQILEMTR